MTVPCPACGRQLTVARAHAGRTARCAECGGTITIPAAPSGSGDEQPDAEASAADEISRAVGNRQRGVPDPQPPRRARAVRVLLIIGLVLSLLALTAAVFISIVL